MSNKTLVLVGGIVSLLLFSCKTYTIPTDSFRDQMVKSKLHNLEIVKVNNPLTTGTITYFANNIDRIYVINKDGEPAFLKNSPSIEMRVTHTNGKRYHMYFDTVTLEDNVLRGSRSRFIQSLTREIPIDSVVKIEVQDGGKKFTHKN